MEKWRATSNQSTSFMCKGKPIWQRFIMTILGEVTPTNWYDKTGVACVSLRKIPFSNIRDGTHSRGPWSVAIEAPLFELLNWAKMTSLKLDSISSEVFALCQPDPSRKSFSSITGFAISSKIEFYTSHIPKGGNQLDACRLLYFRMLSRWCRAKH